jgi:hypothetical protein
MSSKVIAGVRENESYLGDWRKSSYSMSNGQCLEAARLSGGSIGVRDSKAPEGPVLLFGTGAWSALVTELRAS